MIQRNNKFVRFVLEIKYGKPLQWFWSWNTIDYVSAICSFLQQLGIFTLLSSLTSYEARVCFETWVWVRDSAIFEKIGCRCGGTWQLKNYLKYFYLYFLYIFTIKIFLKNTLLCLDSQNKERRRQETPLRSEFRLFRWVSRPISAISGLFRPYQPPTNMIRYGLILAELARFDANRSRFGVNRATSARIKPSRCESNEKKKNSNATLMRGNHVRRGCDTLPTASMLSS